jgi:hypothetical protein
MNYFCLPITANARCKKVQGKFRLCSSPGKSGRGLPQFKTLPRFPASSKFRKILDCGSPLPLSAGRPNQSLVFRPVLCSIIRR